MKRKKENYGSMDGIWRTIGGRRVFIKTGQSLSDAMKESGKFKNMRQDVKDNVEFKDMKEDTIKRKGVTYQEYQRAEDNLAQKKSEYNVVKERGKEINEEARYHSEKGVNEQEYADELREAQKRYDDLMKKDGYMERKYKMPSNEDKFYTRKDGTKDYDNYRNQVYENYRKMAETKGKGSSEIEDLTKINEKTTYDFGKVDGYGNGKKVNRATIDMKLDNGKFTASGSIWNSKGTDIISGGQNLEEMKEYLGDNEDFNTIYNMWKKHHLNDMHSGTERQEEALAKAFGGVNANKYEEQVNYLKSIGLYEDNGYKFGTGWLKRDIPEEDLKTITNLIRKNNLKSRYSETYKNLKETTNMSEAEILELLKKMDKNNK